MDPAIARAELPSRRFAPSIYGVGAWTDNLHFAYDLVATLRPRVFVELGTDRGESYFAFCQSALDNRTGTRCFAVDTWRGDQQAGDYDETTFCEVSTHNDAHYAEFSTLLRCTFDEAVAQFPAESIDILHLDGLHTEEAVRHDLDRWLPKIRPGGILLMHDVSVRSRGFGVWRVWEDMRTRSRSYTFADGPGLGVWQKPPAATIAAPVETLLNGAAGASSLAEYYRSRASELQALIGRQWSDGSIRETAAAHQTVIQLFYTSDGTHREEDSLLARIGHREWKEVTLTLPANAGAAPLRIDFMSALTTIDIAAIVVSVGDQTKFSAADPAAFQNVRVSGDAQRLPHQRYLRICVTGFDPQLYLPPLLLAADSGEARLSLRVRVSPDPVPLD